ncbi:MAG: hypothetical protein ACLFR8_06255 [Alkalispirochaeta sp.]
MIRFVSSILFFFLSVTVSSQELVISSESRLDWQRGTLSVSMSAEAPDDVPLQPGLLHRAQQRIESEFPDALFRALLPMRVNSVETVRDVVLESPEIASQITDLAARATPGLPRPYPDLSGVQRVYDVPIFPDFVQLFVEHTIPFRMEEVISWVPTTRFTGVVIYAADAIPLRGTDRTVFPAPALLPEIYDENLRPVLEQDMIDPDAVATRGVVAYSAETNEDPWRERIGGNPIRIMAREVYGIHPTDLIIAEEDANRILGSDHNRGLLREGRILVILNEERIRITE